MKLARIVRFNDLNVRFSWTPSKLQIFIAGAMFEDMITFGNCFTCDVSVLKNGQTMLFLMLLQSGLAMNSSPYTFYLTRML